VDVHRVQFVNFVNTLVKFRAPSTKVQMQLARALSELVVRLERLRDASLYVQSRWLL
jgi:hypothetical protein